MRLRMILAMAAVLLVAITSQAQGVMTPYHHQESNKQTSSTDQTNPTPLPTALPVSEIKISAKIDGQVATVTVDHLFRNDTDEALEGTYYFPVPDTAILQEFAVYDGDQRRVGRVQEKGRSSRIIRGRRGPR